MTKKKIIFIFAFSIIYIIPHWSLYKNKGIYFSGNLKIKESQNISNFNELLDFSSNIFLESLNLLDNSIFLFFISAFFFKILINLVE